MDNLKRYKQKLEEYPQPLVDILYFPTNVFMISFSSKMFLLQRNSMKKKKKLAKLDKYK